MKQAISCIARRTSEILASQIVSPCRLRHGLRQENSYVQQVQGCQESRPPAMLRYCPIVAPLPESTVWSLLWHFRRTLPQDELFKVYPLPLLGSEESLSRPLCEVLNDHTHEQSKNDDCSDEVVNQEKNAVVLGCVCFLLLIPACDGHCGLQDSRPALE